MAKLLAARWLKLTKNKCFKHPFILKVILFPTTILWLIAVGSFIANQTLYWFDEIKNRLIEKYISSYNAFDLDGMRSVLRFTFQESMCFSEPIAELNHVKICPDRIRTVYAGIGIVQKPVA